MVMKCGAMTDARPLARPDGQVWIYHGALAAHRVRPLPEAAVATVREHLEHESAHLAAWNDVLGGAELAGTASRLLPAWRVAGFLLGGGAVLAGGEAGLCCTVEAVEEFVCAHYGQQVARLRAAGDCPELLGLVERCREEEAEHVSDARAGWSEGGGAARAWASVVRAGSGAAAEVARRL